MPRTREPERPRKIIITAEKGRLSKEEIERMVHEAEEFAEEDKNVKRADRCPLALWNRTFLISETR
jgi:molecular chaperone DnaK (HSP70)